ncbi:MAG TPA: SpoIID/LytB domain-containing protein, partial [Mycobacteriales bacterium]|nr:SpoIID/LytB domain-containing protein [Mycobacteriales bacterium]
MPSSHQPHPSQPVRLLVAVVLVVAGVAGLPVAPAAAAACPPSGGAAIPPATAAGDVVFRGGGWGHGLGMSQYGAQGAARLGCSAEQILTRYYAGTAVVTRPMPASVRLRMLDNGYRVDVQAVQGTLTWLLTGCVPPAPTPTPTATATAAVTTPTPSPTTTPTGPPCPPAQPPGSRWQLRLDDATHSQFVLWDLGVTPRKQLWQGGSAAVPLRLQESGSVAHLTTWRGASVYLERWVRWDWTRFSVDGAVLDAVQQIDTTDTGAAMDKYLWGIAEVPASFPAAALQAQAVAARTYAAKRADRVLMPTPADQNWTGWKKETEGTNGAWGLKWKAAVDATSGRVVADAASGALFDAFYTSSMGGHTEDERYVWGVEAPFLRAVDDSTWDAASSNPAEKRSWATGVTWATLAARLGFASISTVSVPPRGAASRVAGVKVVGIKNGALTTSYVDGWDVRQALGLLSPGFTITMRRTGGPAAQPLVGDWNGDGTDQVGWFRAGQVALQMTGPGGGWVKRFRYGTAGDVAVVGDWDGDGDDDLGVYRAGRWLLRTGLTGGAPTKTLVFGRPGDRPVVGSWTGKRLGLGVVRGRTWLLRRSLTSGVAQRRFGFGRVGDVPVVGSWNGSARTGIGVERDGRWLLRNRRSAGSAGIVVTFGQAADRPVVGDWDGDGRASPGVVRGRAFVLRAGLAADAGTRTLT